MTTCSSWAAPFIMAADQHAQRASHQHAARPSLRAGFCLRRNGRDRTGREGQNHREKAIAADEVQASSDGAESQVKGPSREERETGFYDVVSRASTTTAARITPASRATGIPVTVRRRRCSPRPGSASCRIAPDVPGGIWVPGAAMGQKLIKRLVDNAGLTFAVEK